MEKTGTEIMINVEEGAKWMRKVYVKRAVGEERKKKAWSGPQKNEKQDHLKRKEHEEEKKKGKVQNDFYNKQSLKIIW